jgi:hypothetical protein
MVKSLLTFRDNLLVPSSGVKKSLEDGTDRLSQNVCNKQPLYAGVTSQKSEDLIHILAETWNRAKNKVVFMYKQLTNKHFLFYVDEVNSIQLWMKYDFETGIINVSECPEIVQTTFISYSSLSRPLLAFQ